jgi:predicted RND superfamily exporter protein
MDPSDPHVHSRDYDSTPRFGSGSAGEERNFGLSLVRVLGVALIGIGLVLALAVFFGVVGVIRGTENARASIDFVEEAVRGDSPWIIEPVDLHIEATTEPVSGEEAVSVETTPVKGQPVRIQWSRPVAVFALLFLIALLVRIAMGFMTIGIKMVTVSPQRDAMMKILKEIKRAPG